MADRILLVDDDGAWRYAISRELAEAGYEVVTASDFSQALDQIGPAKFDLLVTDIVMPKGMNGFALARMARLRQRDLKVIYITAYDVPMHEAIGPVLRKPLEDGKLLAEVKALLGG